MQGEGVPGQAAAGLHEAAHLWPLVRWSGWRVHLPTLPPCKCTSSAQTCTVTVSVFRSLVIAHLGLRSLRLGHLVQTHSTKKHRTAQHSTAQHSTAQRISLQKELVCLPTIVKPPSGNLCGHAKAMIYSRMADITAMAGCSTLMQRHVNITVRRLKLHTVVLLALLAGN